MQFTKRRIDKLVCPAGRRDMQVSDDEVRGLIVRVTSTGSKSYSVYYLINGVKRRYPLGSCNSIALDDARRAARKLLGEVALGRDPYAERKTSRSAQLPPALAALINTAATLHTPDDVEHFARSLLGAVAEWRAERRVA
jgi:hypothetical protein